MVRYTIQYTYFSRSGPLLWDKEIRIAKDLNELRRILSEESTSDRVRKSSYALVEVFRNPKTDKTFGTLMVANGIKPEWTVKDYRSKYNDTVYPVHKDGTLGKGIYRYYDKKTGQFMKRKVD